MKHNKPIPILMLTFGVLLSACSSTPAFSSEPTHSQDPVTTSIDEKWDGQVQGHTFQLTGIVIEDEEAFMESIKQMALTADTLEEGKAAVEQLYFDSWGHMIMAFKADGKCEITYPGSKYGVDGITAISLYRQSGSIVTLTTYSAIDQNGSELIYENPSTDQIYVIENGLKYEAPVTQGTSSGYYPFLQLQD